MQQNQKLPKKYSVALPTSKTITSVVQMHERPQSTTSQEKGEQIKRKPILKHNWSKIIHICKWSTFHSWEGELVQRRHMGSHCVEFAITRAKTVTLSVQTAMQSVRRNAVWFTKQPNWVTYISVSLMDVFYLVR